jgi:hypothetical protein
MFPAGIMRPQTGPPAPVGALRPVNFAIASDEAMPAAASQKPTGPGVQRFAGGGVPRKLRDDDRRSLEGHRAAFEQAVQTTQ